MFGWIRLKPKSIERTGDDRPVRSLFRFVWRMTGQHQVLVSLVALAVASLSMAPLELQRRIINNAVEDRDATLLIELGAIYLAVVAVQGAIKFGLRIYQGWLSESATAYCRNHLARIHAERDRDDENNGQGRAVSVITTEIDKLAGFVGEGISQPVVNLGMFVAITGYMLVVDPLVAALSFAFLVPQLILVPFVQSWLNRLIEERLKLIRGLSDTITGAEEDGGSLTGDGFRTVVHEVYRNRIKIVALKSVLKAAVNLMNNLAPLSVLLVGGYLAIQGETTIGIVVAFMSGFDRLADPMRELLNFYRIAAQADVQHRMITRWM
ncbi:ABC transporter transmembrane domain-containing protein [Oceanibacterium hippocampi]|uniref:Putative multidrug export ATP-binding/permease protein n=1 Tax=Oceanibacterium hippocampi TaxID=745714 RepID=A0A1Y5TI14_9PROT|nr:ABC transporter ATP-binding protein [Oceanibacterium hippocampi]SLN62544.1 Putative multidrug export ATP-binding/permease protein [Oceanibacterium hippocampi]